jgi:succinoglycan biosynthesis transport protein ExoP
MLSRNSDASVRSEETYDSQPYDPVISIRDILPILRRDWMFPLFGCLIGLALGLFYILTTPPLYKTYARILVDRSMNRYLQTNKIVTEPFLDQAELESQVHILSSESIILPVVRSLKLTSDREFVGPPKAGSAYFRWMLGNFLKGVKRSIGLDSDAQDQAMIDRDVALERIAVEALLQRMTAYREDVANVITLTISSEDPNKAARIANAIADTFIATSQEARARSIAIALQLLQDRLKELKTQAMESDRALQNYRMDNNVVNSDRSLPVFDQLLTELLSISSELTKARVNLAETQARLERVRSKGGGGVEATAVTGALNDSVIVKLRTQYLDLQGKALEIQSRVEPGHEALTKIHRQMDDLQAAIRAEDERLAASEYENAKAREEELAATMQRLINESKKRSQSQVTMRDLESSAEVSRSLHSSLLQKFQEISAAHTQEIGVQDVRIVTRAAPPLQRSPNRGLLVLAGSIAVGLFLGAGVVVGKEWMADVFRTPDAVTRATGIHSVVLPLAVKTAMRAHAARTDGKQSSIEEFVLDEPYSRFAETLRSVKAMINATPDSGNVKVIGIVSSMAKEGKTTIAANLGALAVAASRSDTRVLIIDGDLHLRNLTALLAPDTFEGLIEALADPSRLSALVCKRPRSGVDVLPCVLSDRIPNAAELLGSPQMAQLLAAARSAYNLIIIEIPPIMSVVDIKVVERLIDRFIFVIEWGHTKRRLVSEALFEADMIRDRILGIVLNKADPSVLRSFEAYKGARFKDYYQA